MLTFQDFEKSNNREEFILQLIDEHKGSSLFRTARDADLYDRQRNKTINEYVRMIFTLTGTPVEDFTASNAKIASNFFNRLNTQRCTYSLGNGVSFTNKKESVDEKGRKVTTDPTKDRLGPKFDTDLKKVGYFGLIHGLCFGFWNADRLHAFPVTEFAPMWDEMDGSLRAGARFWQLDEDKPMTVVLYEEDGFTRYQTQDNGKLKTVGQKKMYRTFTEKAPADEEETVMGEDNYGSLPVIPFWGSRLHQSTLVGMRQAIDSFDLIRSGFANDLSDCSQIYWIVENCGGMTDSELSQFRDRLKINHIANADTDNGGKVTPYTQEIPYQARKEYLDHIRSGIYEDFGALDVHTVAAGATNDHIDAAYQPMDENADDFEYQIIEFVQQLLALEDIEDTPIFKRNRVSNQREQTEMVLLAAEYLDDETILQKLPFITPDEVQEILSRRDAQDQGRFEGTSEDKGGSPFGPDDEGGTE